VSPWRARFAVLAVFLAGCIFGAAAFNLYLLRIENRIFHSPDVLAQLLIYKLDRDLDLTEKQKTEIHTIVIDSRSEVLSLNRDIMPRIHDIFERYQLRIRNVLTPEQQARYDRIVAERRQMLEQIEKSK